MKRIITLLFTLIFFSTFVSSQSQSELNFSLQRKLKDASLGSQDIALFAEGIEFTHPDFRDLNGNTRIKYVWDQQFGPTPISPAPFGFGREWIGSQIDTSTNFTDGATCHGSHVAGTACGNGLAVNNYKG